MAMDTVMFPTFVVPCMMKVPNATDTWATLVTML
jgi:hypothetical protein